MDKNENLGLTDVFYFPTEKTGHTGHQLRNFLSFLTHGKAGARLRFSFVDAEGPLLAKLTLKENIGLNCPSPLLTESREIHLQRTLKETENSALIDFYGLIPSLDECPPQVDEQTRKMAALVKGFLQKSDYLLLHYPEKYLAPEHLKVFTQVLETAASSRTILISGPDKELWRPYATQIVYRRPNKLFEVLPCEKRPDKSREIPLREKVVHVDFRSLSQESTSKKAA